MKVILGNEKIYRGNLILVNANHAVVSNDTEIMVQAISGYSEMLTSKASECLRQVFDKIDCIGKIVPVSGYRTVEEQTRLYKTSMCENGEEFTRKFVALPDHSEHQTGLAIDLGLKTETIDYICPDFSYDGICNEFRKVSVDYGFIERYPEDKETITGISHEPWHFRYVGYPHSRIMSEKNLTLEEYVDYVKDFSQNNPYVCKYENEREIGIFYVKVASENSTDFSLPEGSAYEVSGNNIDGLIVTFWRDVCE